MLRTGLVLVLLLTVAVLSWWLKESGAPLPGYTSEAPRQADYFLKDFRISQYGPGGDPRYQVEGRHMEHFPDDNSTTIAFPQIALFAENRRDAAPNWRITADTAEASDVALDEVWLRDNVEISGDNSGRPTRLQTSKLLLNPGAKTMLTDEPVSVTAPGAQLLADGGLYADLNTGQLEFYRVRGTYEP
jgi:LPS export ABC transporter protein LptC